MRNLENEQLISIILSEKEGYLDETRSFINLNINKIDFNHKDLLEEFICFRDLKKSLEVFKIFFNNKTSIFFNNDSKYHILYKIIRYNLIDHFVYLKELNFSFSDKYLIISISRVISNSNITLFKLIFEEIKEMNYKTAKLLFIEIVEDADIEFLDVFLSYCSKTNIDIFEEFEEISDSREFGFEIKNCIKKYKTICNIANF